MFSLVLIGCATDDGDGFISTDVTDDTEDKADQADLAFTVVDGLTLKTSIGNTEEGRVIRSASSFKTAFGTLPPGWLHFDQEWLAVYSAGVKNTGGFGAQIERIALSDSGKTVKVTSHLFTPGADCTVTDALTKPVAIARFPAQPTASTSRFTKLTDAQSCSGPACGAELTTLLTESVDGLLFTSESDFPFQVLSFGTHGKPTISEFRALIHPPAGTSITQRSYDALFDRLTTVFDPADPFSVEAARKYQALREVLEANLTDLTVFRVGKISIDIYVVGVSSCGELVALKTTSIET